MRYRVLMEVFVSTPSSSLSDVLYTATRQIDERMRSDRSQSINTVPSQDQRRIEEYEVLSVEKVG